MTLSDVARATDLPKPSVRRALYTLTCLGLAASDGRGAGARRSTSLAVERRLGGNLLSGMSSTSSLLNCGQIE